MAALWLYVEMVNTSYTPHLPGGIGLLVLLWSLSGRLMVSMLSGRPQQKSRFSARISRYIVLFLVIRISSCKKNFTTYVPDMR
jgi:hypothetical protein